MSLELAELVRDLSGALSAADSRRAVWTMAEAINTTIAKIQKDAIRMIKDQIETVDAMLSTRHSRAATIRWDLGKLEEFSSSLSS